LHEAERSAEAQAIEIVKKQAANATRFIAVLEKEVSIAPGF
jgi:hypothetical protein